MKYDRYFFLMLVMTGTYGYGSWKCCYSRRFCDAG